MQSNKSRGESPYFFIYLDMFNKEVIHVKDVMYFVKRKIHKSYNPIIEDWKQHLNCDIVFVKDDIYYFCETIQEAQIIENE